MELMMLAAVQSPYHTPPEERKICGSILSFDFSARDTDEERPFKNIKLAEDWAKRNGLLFPPIDADEQFDRDGWKECYVFKDPTNPKCPIVLHFVLVNKTYRDFVRPGIPRTTKEEKKLVISRCLTIAKNASVHST
ncbi:Cytosolic phospholipase A2 [Desmophyllum pertusum]|uniref:Cytosolic phospholipase A2 n=1 Tax=Desmophyllum pertusum TaxID=174260 RepID=A0A9W9Z5T8_9CNID|nr:Cytosolic phospholipase A2 [Desmophyllum pertusum]